jgi:hypothetical protein
MRRAALAVVVVAALSAPQAAAGPGSIRVKPAKVHPGDAVRLSGSAGDCPRGDWVTLISRAFRHEHDFAGLPAVFTRVRTRGRFSVRLRIPVSRHPAHYGVSGRCGGGRFAHATLTVRS